MKETKRGGEENWYRGKGAKDVRDKRSTISIKQFDAYSLWPQSTEHKLLKWRQKKGKKCKCI